MTTTFHAVSPPEEQQQLADMAYEIWHEYWPALIGTAQTDYMVEQFQSLHAIRRDMEKNAYEYWFVCDDGQPAERRIVGYTGGHVEPETNRYFISKIYLYQWARGHHYASKVIAMYDQLCRERGLHAMYLTVNKGNELGIRAYLGKGFKTIKAVQTDIGEGFIMDDYVMERPVEQG